MQPRLLHRFVAEDKRTHWVFDDVEDIAAEQVLTPEASAGMTRLPMSRPNDMRVERSIGKAQVTQTPGQAVGECNLSVLPMPWQSQAQWICTVCISTRPDAANRDRLLDPRDLDM